MPKHKTLPRIEGGIDHGAERILIAQGPNGRRVWWTKGHTAWSGVGQTAYYPGAMYYAADWHQRLGKLVISGGRMATHVKRLRFKIDDFVSGRVDKIDAED